MFARRIVARAASTAIVAVSSSRSGTDFSSTSSPDFILAGSSFHCFAISSTFILYLGTYTPYEAIPINRITYDNKVCGEYISFAATSLFFFIYHTLFWLVMRKSPTSKVLIAPYFHFLFLNAIFKIDTSLLWHYFPNNAHVHVFYQFTHHLFIL